MQGSVQPDLFGGVELERAQRLAADRERWQARERWLAERAATPAWVEAKADHCLAGALDQVDDDSMQASTVERWFVKTTDFGNGHREACVYPQRPDPSRTLERAIERDCRALAPRGEGDREASIAAACRRAKQRVRQTCKAMAVNSLWTLTYRENQTDRDLCLKHLDAFRRRVVDLLGQWRYVAVLERQERGAWHVHLATHALPRVLLRGGVRAKSWDVMRAVWRSVTGELGGNFDEAKRRGRWGTHKRIKGAHGIAAYIAGYVAKDIEASPLNRKRYSRSEGTELPAPVRREFSADTHLAELIKLARDFCGDRLCSMWFDRERSVYFVATDDTVPIG